MERMLELEAIAKKRPLTIPEVHEYCELIQQKIMNKKTK